MEVFIPLIVLGMVGLFCLKSVRGSKDEHSDREQWDIVNKRLDKIYKNQHKKAK